MLGFFLLQEGLTPMVTCKGDLHSSDTCLAASAIITSYYIVLPVKSILANTLVREHARLHRWKY